MEGMSTLMSGAAWVMPCLVLLVLLARVALLVMDLRRQYDAHGRKRAGVLEGW